MNRRAFALFCACAFLWPAPAPAYDWATVAVLSDTLGVKPDRLCVGDSPRQDIGCPSYAPYVSSTSGFIGIRTSNPLTGVSIWDSGLFLNGRMGTGTSLAALNLPVQGAYMTWNETSGGGRTYFLNQRGLGVGGWEFANFDNTGNYLSSPVLIRGDGYVGIGTAAPSTTLHVNGILRLANDGEPCDANRAGAIRYASGSFDFCAGDGVWKSLTTVAAEGAPILDRIISGTAAEVITNAAGTVSFTLGGMAQAAYLHPTQGLVVKAVSTTGGDIAAVKHYGAATDSAAAPAFSWVGDTDTGLYQPSANAVGVTTAGAQRLLVNSTGLTVTGSVQASNGILADGKSIISPVGSVISAHYPDDTHYGYFSAYNNSGARGFYLGYGNGSSIVNLALDAATSLVLSGGTLNMSAQKIIGLATPTAGTDAANKSYVDAAVAAGVDNLGNHTATQALNMASHKIINLLTPTAAADAANKSYVDAAVAAGVDNLGNGGSTAGTLYSKNGSGYGYLGSDGSNFIRFSAGAAYMQQSGAWDYSFTPARFSPYVHNVSDLGTSTTRWKNGYFAGAVYAASFSGDGSGLTGTGDNLGNHTATTNLNMQNHAITSSAGTIRDANGGWVRTYNATGWYNGTYGGGWYMTDSNYIHNYGSKGVYASTGGLPGVTGDSTSSYGVYGMSDSSYGVRGQSNGTYGIRGQSTVAGSGGVIGYSQNGSVYGILGYNNTYVVYGSGKGYFSGTVRVATPVAANDAATKAYVDAASGGTSCAAASVTMRTIEIYTPSCGNPTPRTGTATYSCPAAANLQIVACGSGWAQCKNGSWIQAGLAGPTNSGPGGRCSCFTADTMVAMADGSLKEIHQIKVGDHVKGADGRVNTVVALDHTLLWHGKPQHLIRINGGKAFMTDNHPVKTAAGWKALTPQMAEREAFDILAGKVGQLQVGDEIILADNKRLGVKSIEIVPQQTQTVRLYNLQLDGNHTYFANNMLVHGVVPDAQGRFQLDHSY